MTLGARNLTKIEFFRIIRRPIGLSSRQSQERRIFMGFDSVWSTGLNGDDLPGVQFARGIAHVKSNMATQSINRDHPWRRVFRSRLARTYADKHHSIFGLVDQNLGVDLATVEFNQIIEIVLFHSCFPFGTLRSFISCECYAAQSE